MALMGCDPPPKSDYYKDVNKDEYDDSRFDRFKYEQTLPEYKQTPDEQHYYEKENQKR